MRTAENVRTWVIGHSTFAPSYNIKLKSFMKFLDTKVHGYIDYALASILLFIPAMFHLQANTAQSIIFYVFSILTFFLSLQTDYEHGLYKLLPMQLHLLIEIILGLFLAASPWIFGFAGMVFIPHLLFGVLVILIGLMTMPQSSRFNRVY